MVSTFQCEKRTCYCTFGSSYQRKHEPHSSRPAFGIHEILLYIAIDIFREENVSFSFNIANAVRFLYVWFALILSQVQIPDEDSQIGATV